MEFGACVPLSRSSLSILDHQSESIVAKSGDTQLFGDEIHGDFLPQHLEGEILE